MYTTKAKDVFRIKNLAPSQHINHFEGTKALTTKVGLTHNMKNLIWEHSIDVDTFFPQSYDLSDLKGDEVKDFLEDFRFCQVVAFLKNCMETLTKKELCRQFDKVMVALWVCQRRIEVNKEDIFGVKEWDTAYLKGITDEIHEAMCDVKGAGGMFERQPWFRKVFNTYKDTVNEENVKTTVKDMLDKLKGILGKQYSICGTKNAWILKPGGKSRGRGITIHSKYENILQAIATSQEDTIWVIMKYIENPLIILNKKFDIRQWVVVTSWRPLRVFYYEECYLRFTSDNYDPSRLHNKFMHLTNNCIASQSKNFNQSQIEGNMWHGDQFAAYLGETYQEPNIYRDKIQP